MPMFIGCGSEPGPRAQSIDVLLYLGLQIKENLEIMQLQLLTNVLGSRLDHECNLHVIRKQLTARALVGLDVVDPVSKTADPRRVGEPVRAGTGSTS